MTAWLLLAISFALMVACGLFVAAEFSLVTVDRASVERAAAAGDRRARGTLSALRTLSTQLSGAQLGITITNLAIGFLAEPAIGQLLQDPLAAVGLSGGGLRVASYGLALVISTLVTMLVGELIPKNIALALPRRTAAATQLFQRAFTKLMAWPIRLLNGTANRTVRSFGIEPQEELRSARSPVELQSLVLRSAEDGKLADETAELVSRSIAFGNRTAADVLTPRVRVHFLEEKDTVLDLVKTARSTGHSKFPVIGKSPDDVIGVVHIRQAVGVEADRRLNVRLEELAEPALKIPETVELDPLLTMLREQDNQIAIVVDEYGGTDGIVTLEDLVEEIVGEIADEHDRVHHHSRHRGDGTWSLSGLLRPDEVLAQTGVNLPESDNYETIAGLVLERLGRLAERGDKVRVEARTQVDESEDSIDVEVELTVERVEGRRIERLALTLLEADQTAQPGEAESS